MRVPGLFPAYGGNGGQWGTGGKNRMETGGKTSPCRTFGVVGGDMRQVYLAQAIAADGFPVLTSCLEEAEGLPASVSLPGLCGQADVILLPLPVSRDGKTLHAPFAAEPVPLDDRFASLFSGKRVLGGMVKKLADSAPGWAQASLSDYYTQEELLVGNAVLTAEGAIGAAIMGHPGSINGGRCLVTGFGRIGKALCVMLRGMGAHVDCAARKPQDLASIKALGCTPVRYGGIGGGYDLIFNTVPHLVLTAQALSRQSPGCLLLELASAPGGIDLGAAGRLGLRVQQEPSVPGRMSPQAAGGLIKETVYHMLEEG